jgi:hypothetical protein
MDDWSYPPFFRAVMPPAIILILTIPHVHRIFKRLSPGERESLTAGYEDEDGLATDKSEKRCSNIIQRVVIPITVAVAVLTALLSSLNVDSTPRVTEQLLQFSAWVGRTLLSLNVEINALRSWCYFKSAFSSPAPSPRIGTI